MDNVLTGVDLTSHISHYGIKEKSGRYPYGSGDDPYQRITRASLSKKQKKALLKKAKQKELEMRIKKTKQEAPKQKPITELSEEELRREINRMTLQKQYANLLREMSPSDTKKTESRGKKFVLNLVENVGSATITNLSSGLLTYYGGKAVNKFAGENVFDIKPMPLSKKK